MSVEARPEHSTDLNLVDARAEDAEPPSALVEMAAPKAPGVVERPLRLLGDRSRYLQAAMFRAAPLISSDWQVLM